MKSTDQTVQNRPLPKCRNCAVPMEPGFQIDRGDSNMVHQAKWVSGRPRQSGGSLTWTPPAEASPTQMIEALRVVSFRCPECGLLDCYANDPVKPQ